MTKLIAAFLLASSLTAPLSAAPPETPPLPYEDWGACPFECCTYQDWEATKPVTAYASRLEKPSVAFHVKKGETVRGVTGVVITKRFGVTKILQPVQLAELSMQPGDIVYPLHYQGEGYELFWYKGKTYSDEIHVPAEAGRTPPASAPLRAISKPDYEWWVKIENSARKTGWTKDTKSFLHVNKCE